VEGAVTARREADPARLLLRPVVLAAGLVALLWIAGPPGPAGRRLDGSPAAVTRVEVAGLSAEIPSPGGGELRVLGRVPEFALTDERGLPFARRDLQGTVWIADFVFSSCAGPCPVMGSRMGSLQQRLADRPGIGLLSITVDPRRDTPAVLAGYARKLGARPDRWRFLTGPAPAIHALAREGFKLSAGDGSGSGGDPAGPDALPIFHSTKLVLIDRVGSIRGYYDGTDAADVDRLARDARGLADAPARPGGAGPAVGAASGHGPSRTARDGRSLRSRGDGRSLRSRA
jgi:protein SCO1/2